MRHLQGLAWVALLAALGLAAGAGCQKIGKFPKPTKSEKEDSTEETSDEKAAKKPKDKKPPAEKKPEPLPSDYAWILPTARQRRLMEPEVPIKFVHEGTEPEKWKKLDKFWTLGRTK